MTWIGIVLEISLYSAVILFGLWSWARLDEWIGHSGGEQ